MSMPIDFDLFREVSMIHQKHADWEAITTLSIDDPSYDTYAAGFKTAVGVIEQYITNLKAAKPEQAQTAAGLPKRFCETMPTGRGTYEETDELNIYVKCGTFLYTAYQMKSYATAKTAEAVRELMENLRLIEPQLVYASVHLGCLPEVPGYNGSILAIADGDRDRCVAAIDNARALLTKYAPKKEQG